MAISETITVDAGPAIDQLNTLAGAADRAAAAMERLGKGGAGGAGADKLAASMAAAADRIEAASTRAAAAMGRLSTAGRAATGGLDSAAASADKSAAANDRLAGSADAAAASMDRQAVAGERAGKASAAAAEGGAAGFMKFAKAVTIGFGVAAVYGIDKAMKFNAEVTRLYTAAGLTRAPFQQVSQDLLRIGTQTGYTGTQIAQAMYHPVSAGLDLATSLGLVTQAANLANIHGANLEDTTYALSSVMKAYNQSSKDAVPTAALLNSIVGQGDMRFQDFNESIKNWTPTTAQMGISIQSAGAALAYLTDRGNSAEVASTRLTMGLTMMTVPSQKAAGMLIAMGIAHDKVSASSEAMRQAMEKAHITTNRLAADLKKPDGIYVALTDLKTSLEKAGVSGAQADAIMTKIFGGGRSDKAMMSLMQNLDGVKQKYDQIGQGVKDYGKSVAAEQATAQQKWQDFKAGMTNLATGFGTTLLPYFTSLAGEADKFLGFLQRSKGAADGIVIGLGGIAALFTGKKLISGVESAFQTAATGLRFTGKILGIDSLSNLGKTAGLDTAAAGLSGSASALDGAAASLEGAAASLKGSAAAGGAGAAEGGAAAAGGRGAAAAEGAAAGGLFSKIFGPLLAARGPAIAGVIIGEIARAVGDTIAKAGTPAGAYNRMLQQQAAQGPGPASQLHPYTMGGFEGWLIQHIGQPVGAAINSVLGIGGHPAPPGPRSWSVNTYNLAQAQSQGMQPGIPAALHGWRIPPPDTSALDAAKGKAQAAGQGISDALEHTLRKPVKMAPPDLSAAQAAAGKAKADGAAISAGLAAGIESGKGAAVAAANDVANAVAAAMAKSLQTHSPSRVTHKIGQQAVEGLITGLQGGQPALQAVAAALGKTVAKASDITAIEQTISKAESWVSKDSAMVRWLKGEQGKLEALANKRAMLEQEIKDSTQIAQQAVANASIMGAGQYIPALAQSGGPISAQSTITGLGYMAGDQTAFAAQMKQLAKMGLNATSLSQLAQAGAAQGLPVAEGLTAGGKGAIAQVNALEKVIIKGAAAVGDVGGPAMYAAGQQLGVAAATGLKSELGAVEAAMKQIAQAIVKALEQELHIPIRHGGGGGGGGGGTVHHHHVTVHVHNQGSVIAQQDLHRTIQAVVLKAASNNWQGGMRLPGRAV